jgi:hypothetical protein
MTRQGWSCPRCQRGVSPDEKVCPCGDGGSVLRQPSLNELALRQAQATRVTPQIVVTVVPESHTRTLPLYSSTGEAYPPWYGYA